MSTTRTASPLWLTAARQPETITLALLILSLGAGALLSPYFLDVHFLLDSTTLYMEVGLLALAMTFVIISGNIDLSVGSGLALTAVVTALLHARFGIPFAALIPFALLFGCLLGLINGLFVTLLRLPSLAVTLGTLALYRGVAQILAGDHSLRGFPDWFTGWDMRYVGWLPVPLVIFLAAAVACHLLLSRTLFGRYVYAVGTNAPAARFSGVPVGGVQLSVFILSGLMMGLGALLMLSRLSVARYDMAAGDELTAITAVVLGGASIFGGRGTIFGTVVALLLLGVIRRGMGVANIPVEYQLAVLGTLLILSVLLANATANLRTRRRV